MHSRGIAAASMANATTNSEEAQRQDQLAGVGQQTPLQRLVDALAELGPGGSIAQAALKVVGAVPAGDVAGQQATREELLRDPRIAANREARVAVRGYETEEDRMGPPAPGAGGGSRGGGGMPSSIRITGTLSPAGEVSATGVPDEGGQPQPQGGGDFGGPVDEYDAQGRLRTRDPAYFDRSR